MAGLIASLKTFLSEKRVVGREAPFVGTFPYFVSKMLTELVPTALFPSLFAVILHRMAGLQTAGLPSFVGLVILEAFAAGGLGTAVGTLIRNEDAALALGPAIGTVSILFSGFFLSGLRDITLSQTVASRMGSPQINQRLLSSPILFRAYAICSANCAGAISINRR